ncbi:MAG: hypothetical protein KBT03_02910 [Bacteroidales bacterium]|nr:hypothetical protein [Candidatus Scybalousia scybalohippi]
METYLEINEIQSQLDSALKTLRQNGIALAEAERKYRIAKAKRTLELKEQGYPTTLIPDLTKGTEEIAELCYERDCCDVVFKANQQALIVKQQEYKTCQMYFDKEYQLTK